MAKLHYLFSWRSLKSGTQSLKSGTGALHAPGVARCVLRAVALRARCSIGFAVRLEGRECRKPQFFAQKKRVGFGAVRVSGEPASKGTATYGVNSESSRRMAH